MSGWRYLSPCEGEGDFHMGNRIVRFRQGDILIVDNMKHHGLGKLYTRRCKAISISFLPELVYSPGSPAHAFALLVPFYSHSAGVLMVRDADRPRSHAPRHLQLLLSYFGEAHDQLGCYVYLLELLYCSPAFLRRRHRLRRILNQQHRVRRLAKLLQYIQANYAENITGGAGRVDDGNERLPVDALLQGHHRYDFVSYLTHVRVKHRGRDAAPLQQQHRPDRRGHRILRSKLLRPCLP